MLSSHVHVCLPSSLFPTGLLAKSNLLLRHTPYVPYGFPSFPLCFSKLQSYLTRFTNHESSRCVLICSILLISFRPKIINRNNDLTVHLNFVRISLVELAPFGVNMSPHEPVSGP